MPDITMCTNKSCDDFDKCYRAQAEPSYFQSYAEFLPKVMFGGDICDFFIPLPKKRKTDED